MPWDKRRSLPLPLQRISWHSQCNFKGRDQTEDSHSLQASWDTATKGNWMHNLIPNWVLPDPGPEWAWLLSPNFKARWPRRGGVVAWEQELHRRGYPVRGFWVAPVFTWAISAGDVGELLSSTKKSWQRYAGKPEVLIAVASFAAATMQTQEF